MNSRSIVLTCIKSLLSFNHCICTFDYFLFLTFVSCLLTVTLHIVDVRLTCLINITYLLTLQAQVRVHSPSPKIWTRVGLVYTV